MEIPTTIELPADAKQQLERIQKLYGKEEPLHPDLAADYHVEEGTPHINHPFVCTIHFPSNNAIVNEQYLAKKQAYEGYINEGNYRSAITCIIEKPFRLEYLLKYKHKIPKDQYWPLLRDIWVGVENLWQYKRQTHRLFKGRKGVIRECFRDEKDWEHFQSLPDIIEIYRGCQRHNKQGWSWTLSKAKAEWFARRFVDPFEPYESKPNGIVLNRTIRKDIVHFYTNCRNEMEVVINPRLIT